MSLSSSGGGEKDKPKKDKVEFKLTYEKDSGGPKDMKCKLTFEVGKAKVEINGIENCDCGLVYHVPN